MRFYDYKAQSTSSEVHGSIEALNKKHAIDELNKRGLKVLKLNSRFRFNENIFWIFIRQLTILSNQKITLAESISIISSQTDTKISELANRINIELENGKEFHLILENLFPKLPSHIIGVLRIGSERRGLDRAICAIVSLKETEDALRQEVNKALAYPAFVTLFSLIALIVIFDVVLPEFANLSESIKTNGIQKIILTGAGKGYSTFIIFFWTVLVIITSLELGKRSRRIATLIDTLIEKFPVVSRITKSRSAGEFVNSLSLALDLNCEISDGVRLAAGSVKNKLHKKKLLFVTDELKNGIPLSTALNQTLLFSNLEIASITIAENSQSLTQTIKILASEKIKTRLKKLNLVTQILSPIAILLLGGIIFIIAYTIITPMLMMQNAIG